MKFLDLLNQVLLATNLISGTVPVIEVEQYHDPLVCLAANIYFEAGNQSKKGKDAVAHATLNRVEHEKYPDNICDVVYDARYTTSWKGNKVPRRNECQYSWFCDGKSDRIQLLYANGKPIGPNQRTWKASVIAAAQAITGITQDPTNGATHYWNPRLASPNWGYPVTATIGNHTFATRND